MMRQTVLALIAAASVCLCAGPSPAQTNNLLFNFSSFGLQPNVVRNITIAPLSWEVNAQGFLVAAPQFKSVATTPALTNGSVVFSNQLAGYAFSVTFSGYATWTTNYFIPTNATAGLDGTINVAQYVGTSPRPHVFFWANPSVTNYVIVDGSLDYLQLTNRPVTLTDTNAALIGVGTNLFSVNLALLYAAGVPTNAAQLVTLAQLSTQLSGVTNYVQFYANWMATNGTIFGTAAFSNATAFDLSGAAHDATNDLAAWVRVWVTNAPPIYLLNAYGLPESGVVNLTGDLAARLTNNDSRAVSLLNPANNLRGIFFYSNGNLLANVNSSLFYPNGSLLADTSGNLYAPDGNIAASLNQATNAAATNAYQATNALPTGAFTTVGNAAVGNTNTMKVQAATNADLALTANSVNPTNWNAQALALGVVTTNNFTNTISLPGLTPANYINKTFYVQDYGAIPQGKIANDCRMTAGSTTLTVGHGYDDRTTFTPADVGSSIMVYYAGIAKPVPYGAVPTTNYLALVTTIAAYVNATNVTLAAPALHSIGPTGGGNVDQWNPPFVGMPAIYGVPTSVAALQSVINASATNFLSFISGGSTLNWGGDGIFILTNAPTLQNNCYSILRFPDIIPLGGDLAPTIYWTSSSGAATQLPRTSAYLSFRGPTIVSFYNPSTSRVNPNFLNEIYTNVESIVSCQPSLGNGFFGGGGNVQFNGFKFSLDKLTFITPPDPQYTALDLRGAENVHISDGIYIGSGISYANFGMTNGIYTWPTCTNSWGLMLTPGNSAGDSIQEGQTAIFGFYNGLYPGEHLSAQNLLISTCVNGITPDSGGHPGFWATVEIDESINAIYSMPGSSLNNVNIGVLQMENLTTTNNPNSAVGFIPVAVNETNAVIKGVIHSITHDGPVTNLLRSISGLSLPADVDTGAAGVNTNLLPATITIPVYVNGIQIGPHRAGYAFSALPGSLDALDAWGFYPNSSGHYLTINHLLTNTINSPIYIEDSYIDIAYALVGGNPFGRSAVPMPLGAKVGGTLTSSNLLTASNLVAQVETVNQSTSTNDISHVYVATVLNTNAYNSFAAFPTTAARNDGTFSIGYQFNVSVPIIVTNLGRLYVAGNSLNHMAYLWDLTNSKLLASVNILNATTSDGNGFKNATISSTYCYPGVTYAVVIDETGADAWKDGWSPSLSYPIKNYFANYGAGAGVMPANFDSTPNHIYNTPSMKFTIATGFYGDGSGLINASVTAVTITANQTIASTINNVWYNNSGASGAVTNTLPTAVAGKQFGLDVETAQQLVFDAAGTDTIRDAGSVSASGGLLFSSTIGNTIHIHCEVAGKWVVDSAIGTWTVQ